MPKLNLLMSPTERRSERMDTRLYGALRKLAEKRNIFVKEYSLPEADGVYGLYIQYKGTDLIIINNDQPLGKKIFTLAHELGHFILHRNNQDCCYGKTYWTDGKYYGKIETEADRFAYKLLVLLREKAITR